MVDSMPREKKMVITGLTGQVSHTIALSLAGENDVWGVARFSNAVISEKLEVHGITCLKVDLANPDFSGLPCDFDDDLNSAVSTDMQDDPT